MPPEPFDKLRTAPFDKRRPELVEGLKAQESARRRQPIGVSPGRVVGPVLQLADPVLEPDSMTRIPEAERSAGIKRLDIAAAQVAEQLRSRITAAGAVGDLLDATAAMATDPDLMADASNRIREQGLTAERAVWEAFGTAADAIRVAGPRQAERVTDLFDVRNRIVSSLLARGAPGLTDPGHPYVLVAVDLAPADAAGLDVTRCLAIVTEVGGRTSHAAIMARSLGIPAVVGVPGVSAIADGTLLLVDGATGALIIEPSIDLQATAFRRSGTTSCAGGSRQHRRRPSRGPTGEHRIPWRGDSGRGMRCRGVALYRTELGFLDRTEPPSVAEQVRAYRAVFSAFSGRRVMVRTLDAGSDKPLPFLAYGQEANPALGVRGFRTTVSHPEVLHDQLKAIKEALVAESAEVWVMAPMIATVDEARIFAENSSRRRAAGRRDHDRDPGGCHPG